jgi:hypothetical protein
MVLCFPEFLAIPEHLRRLLLFVGANLHQNVEVLAKAKIRRAKGK